MRQPLFLMVLVSLAAAATAGSLDSLELDAAWGGLAPPRDVFHESFEGYDVQSPFTPQDGWWSTANATTAIVAPSFNGSGRAARHTSDGSGRTGFELNSPSWTPSFARCSADIKRNGNGSVYQFCVAGPQYFNTRVSLETDGTITFGQANPVTQLFDFFPTTGTWTPGVAFNLGVEVLTTGVLNIYKDNLLIASGHDTAYILHGVPEPIREYRTFCNNAAPGNTFDLDDVRMLPEPATLVSILIATLLIRRR